MTRNISKRKFILTLLLIAIAATIWYFIQHRNNTNLYEQEAVTVETAEAKRDNINIQAKTVGSLEADKKVQITPQIAGQVARILCEDGQFVKEGTPLIQLDDTIYKAKADSAKAALIYSEGNYRRMELLSKKGAVSQQALDQALADFKEKKAIAEEAHVLAEKMLLIAPFDGKLGKIQVHPGEYVTVGQPLVLLTDTRHLRVEFTISEKYLPLIKIGQQVTLITSAYPNKPFYGKLSYIAPTINSQDRTISLYADVPNEDGKLTAGLFVNVIHDLGYEKDAVIVPATSLVATIDGQEVYKVIQGKAVSTPVKLGQRTLEAVQILEGIQPGDKVVIAGQQKIKNGTPVKIKEPV